MKLDDLRALGRSGLPVSPLALGTMTFGNKQWASTDEVAREMFSSYVDAAATSLTPPMFTAGAEAKNWSDSS